MTDVAKKSQINNIPPEKRGPGRPHGSKTRFTDELRARVAEAVMSASGNRRAVLAQQYKDGWRDGGLPGRLVPPAAGTQPELGRKIPDKLLDDLQPLVEEYDPVVGLAIMASDHSNPLDQRRMAMASSAEYLRPKLRSIEILEDPESLELMDQKARLAGRMVDILQAMVQSKRGRARDAVIAEEAANDGDEDTSGEAPGSE